MTFSSQSGMEDGSVEHRPTPFPGANSNRQPGPEKVDTATYLTDFETCWLTASGHWYGNSDYTIRNAESHLCLTAHPAGPSAGGVTLERCSGSAAQKWSYGTTADRYGTAYLLHNLDNDQYLTATPSGGVATTPLKFSFVQKWEQTLYGT